MGCLSYRKIKRLQNKRKRRELGELLRNINPNEAIPISTPQIHFSSESIQDQSGLERQSSYQGNDVVLGEFYEPDSEVVEAVFSYKAGLLRKDLSDSGILTSLDSLSENEAWDEYQDFFDRELLAAGLNSLKQKYS